VELRRQIAIIRAWFPLLVACVLLAAGAAFVFSSVQQKLYEAKATLIVGQSLSAVNPDYNQLLASQRLSTTYASVVTTRPILDNVVKQLGLDVTADGLRGRVIGAGHIRRGIVRQDPRRSQRRERTCWELPSIGSRSARRLTVLRMPAVILAPAANRPLASERNLGPMPDLFGLERRSSGGLRGQHRTHTAVGTSHDEPLAVAADRTPLAIARTLNQSLDVRHDVGAAGSTGPSGNRRLVRG